VEEGAAVNTFAAAVLDYEAALSRFDGAPPPGPRLVDWDAIREPSVIAEEAELERLFGRGTRSAGGGGETRSPARAMGRDVDPMQAHAYLPRGVTPDAILAVLVKGPATVKQIADAAHLHFMAVAHGLRRMERKGLVERAGGGRATRNGMEPIRWSASAANADRPSMNADRPSMNAGPGLVNKAAAGPREVEEMPKGKRVADEEILAVLTIWKTPRSAAEVAVKAGCNVETAGDVLRRLEKAGKVTWARGLGRGGPKVWRLFDVPPETGKAPCVSARVEIEAKVAHASAPVPVGQVSSQRSLADLLEREVVREAKRRAAAILNDVAHQLMVEAEAAGGGA
jgi:predicted transcriptional regulator